jgi:uncharacterized protein (TIGR00730 family)
MTPKDFNLEEELQRSNFRVSIFGSARPKDEDPVYQETYKLAKSIGEEGMDLITGGGPGLMEAASLGHTAGDYENRGRSIGLNIRLPFEQKPNEGLELIQTHERFSTRLDEFMILSNVVVVMPGGIGTCLELFYTWQLLQVKHICRMPIILVGDMWTKLIEWVKEEPLRQSYLNPEDLNFIVQVKNADEAFQMVLKAKAHFEELGPDACINWKKYGS